MNTSTDSIILSDQRRLSFADLGDPNGPPIFFFHGSGASADGLGLADLASRLRLRVISAARPGMGRSSPHNARTLSSFGLDIIELADHLGIQRFSTLGISGGGPYALAVAHHCRPRVIGAGAISCGGPFDIADAFSGMAGPNKMLWTLVQRRPGIVRFALGRQAKQVAKSPQSATRTAMRSLRGADRDSVAALSAAQQQDFFATPLAEALINGPDAMVQDMQILRGPWGFDLAELHRPVHLWHGEEDSVAPVAMARHLADRLDHCTLQVGAVDGHLSTILNNIEPALVALGRESAQ